MIDRHANLAFAITVAINRAAAGGAGDCVGSECDEP